MSIPHIGVHPDHLVKISEQHKWPFSAIETLLAYGRGARVTEITIDTKVIDCVRCLVFNNNGVGMDKYQLHKMFSLGYCEKKEGKRVNPNAGHIGIGCMSGSLRLGKDMLVFTRNKNTAAIGFLSLTYLDAVKSDIVVVPLLEYSLPDYHLISSMDSSSCLKAVLDHSIFPEETKLLDELKELKKTGTRIIISNLRSLQSGDLELDFHSSPKDIRCRRAVGNTDEKFKESLKEYLESVNLNHKPNVKITVRDENISLLKQKRTSFSSPDGATKKKKKKVNHPPPDNNDPTRLTTLKYQPMQESTVHSSQGAASERHTDPNRRQSNSTFETPSTSNVSQPSVDLNLWFSSLPPSEQQKLLSQFSARNFNIEFNLKHS